MMASSTERRCPVVLPDRLPECIGNYDEAEYHRLYAPQRHAGHQLVYAADRVHRMMRRLFGEPQYGTSRATFIDRANGIVYKIPRVYSSPDDVMYGCEANYCEKTPLADFPCAVARILHDPRGIPILAMEYVATDVPREEKPEWANWIDCGQVGRALDGELVAYDFATTYGYYPTSRELDLPERFS